jgi:hypothetical protein
MLKMYLQEMQSCLTEEIANSTLKRSLKGVKKGYWSQTWQEILWHNGCLICYRGVRSFCFCNATVTHLLVLRIAINLNSLRADRWAALIAAWHMRKRTDPIVVNAGTAITIDALARDATSKGGCLLAAPLCQVYS